MLPQSPSGVNNSRWNTHEVAPAGVRRRRRTVAAGFQSIHRSYTSKSDRHRQKAKGMARQGPESKFLFVLGRRLPHNEKRKETRKWPKKRSTADFLCPRAFSCSVPSILRLLALDALSPVPMFFRLLPKILQHICTFYYACK